MASFNMGDAFYLYATVVLSSLSMQFQVTSPTKAIHDFSGFALNLFVMAVLLNLGSTFNLKHFTYWRTNTYTKRIAYMKLLAVPTEVIIIGRLMQFILTTILMSIIMFVSYYLIMLFDNLPKLGGLAYIAFALFWMGISMIAGCLHLYWEMGGSGKVYLRNCLLMVIVYGAISWLGSVWMKESFWTASMHWARDDGFIISVCSIAIGIGCLFITAKLLKKKLEHRDLYV